MPDDWPTAWQSSAAAAVAVAAVADLVVLRCRWCCPADAVDCRRAADPRIPTAMEILVAVAVAASSRVVVVRVKSGGIGAWLLRSASVAAVVAGAEDDAAGWASEQRVGHGMVAFAGVVNDGGVSVVVEFGANVVRRHDHFRWALGVGVEAIWDVGATAGGSSGFGSSCGGTVVLRGEAVSCAFAGGCGGGGGVARNYVEYKAKSVEVA